MPSSCPFADEQLASNEALESEQLAELGTLRKVSVQLDAEERVLYLIDPPPYVNVRSLHMH